MFRISLADEGAARVIRLEGWVDGEALPALDDALAAAGDRKIVLDLAAVRWIGGPAAVRLARERAMGASFRSCSEFLERLLKLAER